MSSHKIGHMLNLYEYWFIMSQPVRPTRIVKTVSVSKVSVALVRESVEDAVREAMELADWKSRIPEGADVALKPNLGFDFLFPGSITSPWAVEGVIKVIRDRVKSITLVEADQVLVDIERSFRRSGLKPILDRYGIQWYNMSKGRFMEVPVPDGLYFKTMRLPEILTRTVLVTVPVMKTHDKTTISGAIKNQWGYLEPDRHNLHLVVNEVLTDLHQIVKPAFAVCDATIALEGNGPKTGLPRICDRVLASGDIVALDSVLARIMGFDPLAIRHLTLAQEKGIGVCDPGSIEVVGEDISSLDFGFKPARHNFVSVVELALRRSPLRPLVFKGLFFRLSCFSAYYWYWFWYNLGSGKRTVREIIRSSRYGRQWDGIEL